MKKLKKTDPVVINLAKVEEALYDSSAEVPGSKLNRKMLIEALPKALGDGAASDERHAYQKIIADAIGQVLSAEVKKFTEKVAASQAEYDVASADKTAKDGSLAEKQGKLEAKKTEVQEKKDAHHADKQAQKDAEHALKDAHSEVEHFDGNMKKKEDDKTKYEALLNVTLVGLKKGEYENAKEKRAAEGKGLESLKSILTGAGADDSLIICFPAALQKEPEKRGEFDKQVIAEVENRIGKMIRGLGGELAQGPSLKEKKIAEEQKAVATKDAAIAKQEASAEALKVAEQEKAELDAVVKSAASEVKDSGKVQETKHKVLSKDTDGLENANACLEAFKFLVDRPSVVPEEETKEAPMEEEQVFESDKPVEG